MVIRFVFGVALAAMADQGVPTIQSEINRLEARVARKEITAEEKNRLAEIYFLTSRCEDVRALKGAPALIACACGGKCGKSTEAAKIARLRELLEGGASWTDARVRALWHQVESSPEARYWAVKSLRLSRESRVVPVRADLEKSLESLEVQPTGP